MKKQKNKFLWSIIFIVLAALSIWAVMAQNKEFSFKEFLSYINEVSPLWICAAIASMLAFIIFEAYAINCILKGLGYKTKRKNRFFYSAADIYFSAITPSATGGQPATAYFMMKDGIPGVVVTVTLLIYLIMYTISLIIIGLISFIVYPGVFLRFSTVSKVLIIFGCVIQVILALLFYLLLNKEKFLHQICTKILQLLGKIHIIRHVDRKLSRLDVVMNDYHNCANMIYGQKKMLLKALLYNVLQRISQIAITVFVFLATGGTLDKIPDIWSIQSFVTIGAYCIPIPGAIGVTDYLMLDGFKRLMEAQQATHLELLSRTLSFYCCILICGISVIIKYFLLKRGCKDDRIL